MTGLLIPVDQVSAGAMRLRATAGELEAGVEALHDAARRAEEASHAAAHAADLAARIPPVGVDPELERVEFIVSFHESGHAEYAAQSRLMVPVSAEMDVDRALFIGPPPWLRHGRGPFHETPT